MYDKYIVLICDPESGIWSLQVDSAFKEDADNFVKELDSETPRIELYTGDYISFAQPQES